MRAAAGVVVDKAGANVRGEADVEVGLWIGSLQNVDESLVFGHAKTKATAVPSAGVSNIHGLAL